jgi:hypothetical protein
LNPKEEIRLPPCWTDQLGPLDAVASLAQALVRRSSPERVAIIRVRDWFGPNWFRFLGKVVGAAGAHARRVENVTIPPFVPERVLAEAWWQLDAGQNYVACMPNAKLHIQQLSERNLHRLRRAPHVLGKHALALWIGRGGDPERVAILVINTCGEESDSWYAEGELNDDGFVWGKCAGVSHRDLVEYASYL